MTDANQAFDMLVGTLKPLASSPASRELLHHAFQKAGIRVDDDFRALGRVTPEQIEVLIEAMDVKSVWKLATRRVMRDLD